MYLVVDCETSGLPRNWKAPFTDLGNWPRAVQIAWLLYDSQQRELRSASHVIRPDGFSIPPDAAAIHGITTERALREGIDLRQALTELAADCGNASYVIAHNASFDGSVLAAEFLRQGWQAPFHPQTMICTMQASTAYCALPGVYGYKWPRLEELYAILFGSELSGAHDAQFDAAACARCFFELESRGVIRIA